MGKAVRLIFGYLCITIRGEHVERFLNLCAGRRIHLWNLQRNGEICRAMISLREFYKLHTIVRKTKVRVAIQKRMGLPFFVRKMRTRWVFFACAALAPCFCLMTSRFLWSVEFTGCGKVTEDQCLEFLLGHEIMIGMRLSDIDETEMEKLLRKEFEDIIWTNVQLVGTTLRIDLKERDVPKEKENAPDRRGMDLLSPFDGTIVSMIVRSGVPKVKQGDHITKEQVLVSGSLPIYQEDGTIKEILPVTPDATIWIERERWIEDAFSVTFVQKEPTGREMNTTSLILGGRELNKIKGKWFYDEVKVETTKMPKLFQILRIPVMIRKTSHLEALPILEKYEEEELFAVAEEKILRFLATLEEKGVQIIEKDVKISIEGDCCQIYGSILVRERADLFRKTEDEFDGIKQVITTRK